MLSEEFDKKLRDAAEHHHPAYDEGAWMKMEKLLDKHMPVEEERKRRFIFILLFFLLLGGGAWFYFGSGRSASSNHIALNDKNNTKPASNNNDQTKNTQPINPVTTNPASANTGANNTRENSITTGNNPVIDNPVQKPSSINPGLTNKNSSDPRTFASRKKPTGPANHGDLNKANNLLKNTDGLDKSIDLANKTVKEPTNTGTQPAIDPSLVSNKSKASDLISSDLKKDGVTANNKNIIPDNKIEQKSNPVKDIVKEDKKKSSGRKKNSFFITASAGPDMSIVGTSETGRVKLVGGGGIGYTFHDKFSISTGFYTARKIYDAYPEDYHAPSAFYSYYPNLQKVKADCKVYEIPIAVRYNFGKGKKQNWFATTGISTYLMKRETYDFYYKYTSTGPTVNRQRTIYNSNDHYFSVLTLSGGYQKKINNTISVAAEPFLKIPLTGIGFGKVKLNSAGVLFTVAVTPFHSKAKK